MTTHWTTVLQAAQTGTPEKSSALEKLCRAYWYPLFVFVRRKGYAQQDAEDLTQAFFEYVLSKEAMKKVDQSKGRFRSFLLAAMSNFLANEWDKRKAQRRGGDYRTFVFTDCSPEELYRHEPVENYTPERLFERRWAFIVIERVIGKLRVEYENTGRKELVTAIEPFLTAETTGPALVAPAGQLGMSPEALKVAVHRMRRRFGLLLRGEVALTVSSDEEVDAEVRALLTAISQ